MAPQTAQPGQRLPPYRVVARNAAALSDNKIHSDDGARTHGFRGGLVPGITTFGYMTRPLVEALGLAWLDHGSASIRLQKPVYEGEPLAVVGEVTHVNDDELGVALTITSEEGETKATGVAALLLGPRAPMDLSSFPRAPLPITPRVASRASLAGADMLGSVELRFDASAPPLFEIDDVPPIYREAAIASPALLLGGANAVFAANVALGPWIHLRSDVTLSGRVKDGDRVSFRGKIERLYEKKGRELVDLDVLVVAAEERPVMRIKHTAMYRL